jgi:hypothetical protein
MTFIHLFRKKHTKIMQKKTQKIKIKKVKSYLDFIVFEDEKRKTNLNSMLINKKQNREVSRK